MEVKTVRPARRDSYEYAFRRTGINRALADWRGKLHGEPATALREPLLERARDAERVGTELSRGFDEDTGLAGD